VNDLPLSLVLSWYEQKAVAVLLTLPYLGVRNIRIGPTLPAFLSPSVLDLLHEKFNLIAITSPEQDLAAMLA
jgi:hydroxylamine reductase